MAISTRKKNLIIADWKTGIYSLNKLAKKHKISTNSVKKICANIPQTNADIIKVCAKVEEHKNCTKNAQEIKAIETVVQNRLKIDKVSNKLVDKIDNFIDKNEASKIINKGEAGVEIIKTELQAKDYRDLSEAKDKASLTLGVNKRFGNEVSINNQNNQMTNLKVEFE